MNLCWVLRLSKNHLNWHSITDRLFDFLELGAHRLDCRGALQEHDRGSGRLITRALRIVVQGHTTSGELGKLEKSATTDSSTELEITYIKIDMDGKKRLELDKLNYIYRVNGKDQWLIRAGAWDYRREFCKMKLPLPLEKPLRVDDKEITSLTFDFDKLTGADIINATDEARQIIGFSPNDMQSSAFRAVLAAKACGVLYHDLLRLGARDFYRAVTAAHAFLLGMDLKEMEEIEKTEE
ncbi:phage major tail tube protein [Brevibacillus brevis]|uniref:phage major tail tube protein n=2 Tax=Brevibacillus brevis TaxID=1393 RepID=UPI0036456DF4